MEENNNGTCGDETPHRTIEDCKKDSMDDQCEFCQNKIECEELNGYREE